MNCCGHISPLGFYDRSTPSTSHSVVFLSIADNIAVTEPSAASMRYCNFVLEEKWNVAMQQA